MAQNPVVFVALLLPLTRVKTHLKGRTNFNLKACLTLVILSHLTTLRFFYTSKSTFYSLELKKTNSLETFVNAIADWFFSEKDCTVVCFVIPPFID